MLLYVKSFCAALFIILSMVVWYASSIFKDQYIGTMVDHAAHNNAVMLSTEYIERIWTRYHPVIDYIKEIDPEEWSTVPHFRLFNKENKMLLLGQDVLNIKVLDSQGRPLFEQNASSIKGSEAEALKQGLKREKYHLNNDTNITHTTLMQVPYMHGNISLNKDVTISKIPLKIKKNDDEAEQKEGESEGEMSDGTMVIYYDMTDMVASVDYIRVVLLSIVLGILALMLIVIVIISRRTHNLLEAQHEKGLELQKAQKMAERQSKAKGRFIANVSHELRTPLNAIIGFSEIIDSESMGPVNNPQYKEFIHDIHASGKHLLTLINDILDYSKAEEQKLELDIQDVDVTKVIQTSMRMVAGRAKEGEIELITDVPEEHIVMKSDTKRLKQVLLNLLSNSVKFTNKDGKITVKAWRDDPNLIIEVKDTGVGMKAQDISRALSPFGQVDSDLAGKHDGTGLGLPLTKKLVELMGGKLDLRSEQGLGTHVSISLPIR